MYQLIIHVLMYAFTCIVTKASLFKLKCAWAHKWVQIPLKKLKYHSSITIKFSVFFFFFFFFLDGAAVHSGPSSL